MTDKTQPSRRIDKPMPGFFRCRIVKGGPYVGARIFWRLGILAAEVNGDPADVDRVWTSGERIHPADWEKLDRNRHPDPGTPIDFKTLKPSF